MTVEKRFVAPKRRTRAEVQQLVAEFVSSGMRRSEFCRSRGLSLGTLNRHLKKQRWKRKSRAVFFGRPVGAGGVGRQEIAGAAGTELWADSFNTEMAQEVFGKEFGKVPTHKQGRAESGSLLLDVGIILRSAFEMYLLSLLESPKVTKRVYNPVAT